ncbi:BnaC03g14500D [Brassica napus]|uniref:BnaC03g14500D protein n=1 Tax=Brassica napus TaxID=3708 RepID=A0A078I142_BRANA|nr:BnaC03g14500D [Brassica napus]
MEALKNFRINNKRTRQDPLRVPNNFGLFVYIQTVGSWSLKPDNLLKWEPSTPEILCAFGFLFVVLTSLVGNGESGSRVCAEVKGVQYKVTSLTTPHQIFT